jgi:hypothetical protein
MMLESDGPLDTLALIVNPAFEQKRCSGETDGDF